MQYVTTSLIGLQTQNVTAQTSVAADRALPLGGSALGMAKSSQLRSASLLRSCRQLEPAYV